MASFDIISEVDLQSLDNAVNNLKKEILNRFDFQNSETEIELLKKEMQIRILTESEMRIQQIEDLFISKLLKQQIDPRFLDRETPPEGAGKRLRKLLSIRNGLDKDEAKKIVKIIKDQGWKVQASIMDEKVRVTGKKIDDLQLVMQFLRNGGTEVPLQFENFKS
ncbi:MAG: YajQ family cyclic di-GMP-binding protein [Sphingobacteriia bacterium]|jgi:hypothetical protein|nr:YajQ family cyclic di-GMP-binding protein [Sphingobacteriia bacterium]